MSTLQLQAYLQPDAYVGEFIVEKTLPEGKGGMAIVFIGRPRYQHESMPKQVAVKVSLTENQKYLNHEVLFLKRFNHPHVIQMYPLPKSGKRDLAITTLAQIGQVYYYAMEYLPGGTLRTLLKQRSRLSVFEILTVGRQLAWALEHIHSHKIINLDIKPENILLRPPRRSWFRYAFPEAVLCDFGAARAIDGPGLGSLVGSPSYLSPEQVQEMSQNAPRNLADYRSDLFVLGILLYEMTTGQLPFDNMGLIRDPSYRPVPPAQLRPNIPDSLSQVIMRALAKDPVNRFQSASEMRLALEAVPQGIYWRGIPKIAASFVFMLLFAGVVYIIGPSLPLPTIGTATATATHTAIVTKTATQIPATATPTLVTLTPTTTRKPTVTPAPTRTPTSTPRPTARPTSTPDDSSTSGL
jgi:serine/threonine protein kinase